MKPYIVFLLLLVNFSYCQAQIFDPIDWSTSVEKVSESEYVLVSKASIDEGWHLYAQKVPENGPIPTSFTFDPAQEYKLLGETSEIEGHTAFDPVFEMEIKYFEKVAEFRQRIKVLDPALTVVEIAVEFMVCDDSRCLPPTFETLTYTINGSTGAADATAAEVGGAGKSDIAGEKDDRKGLWTIFFISFLSGFAALLTPCVFPMIPLTVSFFTKQSKSKMAGIRNSIMYGLAIIVIYVALGSLVTAVFGADSLNALATNVWFNLIFFVLLVVFALSFLGAFEIVLPSSWGTNLDSKADRGGIIGILFMALALAVVSFSCTGPIVGTLLVEAASKGGIAPVVGMFGFSLAIALPFALFAAFPGWMNSMPKSGGWLNTVKVSLGFLELALAFKFLSNADLVLQLHLLERETFLVIWIVIFGALGFYLLGKIKLPHDSPQAHISVGRLTLGLFVLAFTFYMIPGLWGAPLQWISGFPPPIHYSESPYGVGNSQGGIPVEQKALPEGAVPGPHDIAAFKDYETGMAYAKKVNKPVLLDFTGYACVNCRKMEERVWPDPKVLDILRNEVVLISLYVDEKTDLPLEEQYISETTGKEIETVGNKWSDFQIEKYNTNAQPYYVLLDHEGENLNPSIAYEPDIDSYFSWLKKGIGQF